MGNCSAKLYDTNSGRCIGTMKDHKDYISSVAFSKDEKYCLTGSKDGTAKLWEIKTGKCLQTLREHCNEIVSVSFSKDGKLCLTGSKDQTVKIWASETGKCILTLGHHTSRINLATVSENEKYCLIVCENNELILYNTLSNTCACLSSDNPNSITAVAVSPNGNYYLVGFNDGKTNLCETHTMKCLHSEKWGSKITCASFSKDEDYLLIGTGALNMGRTMLLDTKSGRCLRNIYAHSATVSSLVFSVTGELYITGSWDRTSKIWNTKGETKLSVKDSQNIWEQALRKPKIDDSLYTFKHDVLGDWIKTVAFSPDGKFCLTSSDLVIKMWNTETYECVRTISMKSYTSCVQSVTFSPDGKKYIAGFNNATIQIWNTETGNCLYSNHLLKDIKSKKSFIFYSFPYYIITDNTKLELWMINYYNNELIYHKHIDTFYNIDGLHFQNCSAKMIHGSKTIKKILRQYGALIDDAE